MNTSQWMKLNNIEWKIKNDAISNALSALLAADRCGNLTDERLKELYSSIKRDKDKEKFIEYIKLAMVGKHELSK